MAVYSKEFLLDAFCFRYEEYSLPCKAMREQASAYYDTVDKKKFRESCGLDAVEITRYKEYCEKYGLLY